MSLDLHPGLAMETLLKEYPGARRALFASFHIGGCQSCAYKDDETLAEVCKRNDLSLEEALTCLKDSHTHDQKMLIAPEKLKEQLESQTPLLLLDIRTREEHEAITIPGSELMTQENQSTIFSNETEDSLIILFDHLGRNVLDQCAWFRGHGLIETYGLDGGIDRYAEKVDSTIKRYRLEID